MSAQSTPIDLLKLGDEDRCGPLLNDIRIWPNLVGVFAGVGTGVLINFATRRPYFSGIQKHILLTAGYCAVLNYVSKRRMDYLAEKDAVLRHYIELHPEDFPVPPRRKISKIFEPWYPIR